MLNRSYIVRHKGHPHYIQDSKLLFLLRKANSQINEKNLEVVKNLSDPTKLKIYLLLARVKEIPVSDIKQILGLSQSAISHALSDLRKIGLVEAHRCGQLICYSLKNNKRKGILSFLERLSRIKI